MVLCDSRHQFAASHGTRFSIQYIAFKIRFLLTIFKEGAENVSIPLADLSHLIYTQFIAHESFI
jgi:hypothetical protein